MSISGQLRTLALNENRIRSDSDPTAGRMKSISRAGSIDTTGSRKKTQRQSSITQFIYKDPKLNLGNACSTPEKHVSKITTQPVCCETVFERYFQTKSNQKVDKEIQVSNNLEGNLCEDEPNEEYWKELAKEREKALNDTLEENRSLCELIQGNVSRI